MYLKLIATIPFVLAVCILILYLWPVPKYSFNKIFSKVEGPLVSFQKLVNTHDILSLILQPVVLWINPFRKMIKQHFNRVNARIEVWHNIVSHDRSF